MVALRVILLLVASAALFAEAPQLKTIETGDINRSADPCADFFEFANGAWRAQNPIPAVDAPLEPALGGRREQQGAAQEILDEVSAKRRTSRRAASSS